MLLCSINYQEVHDLFHNDDQFDSFFAGNVEQGLESSNSAGSDVT